MTFRELKVGDAVTRDLCGIKMPLKVTEVDERFIHCGWWKFDRDHGYEVDEELGWGVPQPAEPLGMPGLTVHTGSTLVLE